MQSMHLVYEHDSLLMNTIPWLWTRFPGYEICIKNYFILLKPELTVIGASGEELKFHICLLNPLMLEIFEVGS